LLTCLTGLALFGMSMASLDPETLCRQQGLDLIELIFLGLPVSVLVIESIVLFGLSMPFALFGISVHIVLAAGAVCFASLGLRRIRFDDRISRRLWYLLLFLGALLILAGGVRPPAAWYLGPFLVFAGHLILGALIGAGLEPAWLEGLPARVGFPDVQISVRLVFPQKANAGTAEDLTRDQFFIRGRRLVFEMNNDVFFIRRCR